MPVAFKKKSAKKTTIKKTAVKTKTLAKKVVQLDVGAAAPAFSMPATVVGNISSASLKGKPYVIYFYPKDDTPGCTTEACDFRDAAPAYKKLGVPVIGVSKDDLKSHAKFAAKFNLTFPLAQDETGEVCESFGVWVEKSMYGRKYMGIDRSTFLVDGKGKIRSVWRKVSVPGHVRAIQKAIAEL